MRYIATYEVRSGDHEILNLRIIEAKDEEEAWELAEKLCKVYNYWDWEIPEAMIWKLVGIDKLMSYPVKTRRVIEGDLKEVLEAKA